MFNQTTKKLLSGLLLLLTTAIFNDATAKEPASGLASMEARIEARDNAFRAFQARAQATRNQQPSEPATAAATAPAANANTTPAAATTNANGRPAATFTPAQEKLVQQLLNQEKNKNKRSWLSFLPAVVLGGIAGAGALFAGLRLSNKLPKTFGI